jgi:predicted XRE-type DNA-binding protein
MDKVESRIEAGSRGACDVAKDETVTYSTESAFHALGLPDADDLVLRAELMRKIAEVIAARGLTQVQGGELMHMDQPRVSALLAGKIAKFSTDRLLRALSDLGQDVELRITPARGARGRLHVTA